MLILVALARLVFQTMASLSLLPSAILLVFVTSYESCPDPQNQQTDSNLICNIFQPTNIDTKLSNDFSDYNYCAWGIASGSGGIGCTSTVSTAIDWVQLRYYENLGISGTLDFTLGWPVKLRAIRLDQSSSSGDLTGEWNWDSIKPLYALYDFSLNGNQFTGTITNDIWNDIVSMQALQGFKIQDNSFDGDLSTVTFPEGTVSTLRSLNLQNNQFTGTVDVSFTGFFSIFPEMRYLNLGYNDIYAEFEGMDIFSSVSMPELTQFRTQNCHFSGDLVMGEGFSFSPKLQIFDIYGNDFEYIDWEIFNSQLTALWYLRLQNNVLEGAIDPISLPPKLQQIILKNNAFTSIDWIAFNSDHTSLKIINMEGNDIVGFIDANNIKSLPPNLEQFVISDNKFSGTFDVNVFANLPKLKYIFLERCDFSGSLSTLPYFPSLTHFRFDYNEFDGILDLDIFQNCPALIEIDANHNKFSGPFTVTSLAQTLQYLDISENEMSGPITNWDVFTNTSLKSINLSKNKFNGTVDWDALTSIDNLLIINFNFLSFSGQLNPTQSFPSSFQYLHMYGNDMNGSINWDIFSNTQLIMLDFTLNDFSGEISMSNGLLFPPTLKKLEFAHNEFRYINWLSFANVPLLYELDADSNQLTGEIDWNILKTWTALQNLDLHDNALYGSIDGSGFASSIKTVYLYDNKFNGTVQWDGFSACDKLSVIDIGDNELTGGISMSNGLTFPSSLTRLEADSNNFDGTIDWQVFNGAYNLVEIDLDYNHFTGPIDWDVIADLHQNGKLKSILLQSNDFTGYVNFKWITKTVSITLPREVHCDPVIYPKCESQSNRRSTSCNSKASCEATCDCLPTKAPTLEPTPAPTNNPTTAPSNAPSKEPTPAPTDNPSTSPSNQPSNAPSSTPTDFPSTSPISAPTLSPTDFPSSSPISQPTQSPTTAPSLSPTHNPTVNPTQIPSSNPSQSPSISPISAPTISPSNNPTIIPSTSPSIAPSFNPTQFPSNNPSLNPTISPSNNPLMSPSNFPTNGPSASPLESTTIAVVASPTVSGQNTGSNEPAKADPLSSPASGPSTFHWTLITIMGMIIMGCCCLLMFVLVLFWMYRKKKRKQLKRYETDVANMIAMERVGSVPPQSPVSPAPVFLGSPVVDMMESPDSPQSIVAPASFDKVAIQQANKDDQIVEQQRKALEGTMVTAGGHANAVSLSVMSESEVNYYDVIFDEMKEVELVEGDGTTQGDAVGIILGDYGPPKAYGDVVQNEKKEMRISKMKTFLSKSQKEEMLKTSNGENIK